MGFNSVVPTKRFQEIKVTNYAYHVWLIGKFWGKNSIAFQRILNAPKYSRSK